MKRIDFFKSRKEVIISGLIMLLFLIVVFTKIGIFYDTNDDRLISEILSAGGVSSKPDAHTIYVNYLLSLPFMILYECCSLIPWYGLFLFAVLFFSFTIILKSVLHLEKSITGVLISIASCVIVLLSSIIVTAAMQYTTIAALLALAGYCYLLSGKRSDKELLFFFVIELFAFLLRENAMLMVQPLGMSVFVGISFSEKKNEYKKSIKYMLKAVLCVLAIFIIGAAGNYAGYSSKEWKEYRKYNEARTTLLDFYGMPDYEEVTHILEKYGISETEYKAYKYYVIIDQSVDEGCILELAEYVNAQHVDDFHFDELLTKTWKGFFDNKYYKLNDMVHILWIAAVATAVFSKKIRFLIPLSFLFVSRMIIWMYLEYNGRMPNRVTMPLFLCESVLLLLIIISIYHKSSKGFLFHMLFAACICGAIYGSYRTGQAQYRYILPVNQIQKILSQNLEITKEYCQQHPENRYILDNSTYMPISGMPLEFNKYKASNYIYSGGWFSYSPIMQKRIEEEYDWTNPENIFLIVYETPNIYEENFFIAEKLIEEKTGKELSVQEVIDMPTGGKFLVMGFE